MQANNIKVSIIIPVFNVEKYIYKCINSIVQQSYKYLEIIIVNDGTKDQSIEKIKDFLTNDERIKLITKENEGLFAARVDGIHNATGDYILFVDADDWIELDFVSDAIEYIQHEKIDYVKTRKIIEKEHESYILAKAHETWVVDRTEFHEKLYPQLITTTLYNQIPGQIIKKTCFDLKKLDYIKRTIRINYAEDMLFNILLLPRISKYVYLKKAHYHYRQNHSSITKKLDIESLKRNISDCIFVYTYLIKYFNGFGQEDYIMEASNRYLVELMNCLYKYLYYSDESKYEKINYLKNMYYMQETLDAINNYNDISPFIKKYNKKLLLNIYVKKHFKLCVYIVNIIKIVHIKKS